MRHRDLVKQQKILDFMNRHLLEKGYPPSVREICEAVGFKSTSSVHAYLKWLEEEGQIQKDVDKPRALRIMEEGTRSMEGYIANQEIENIPVLGRITAGQPILALENIEDTFPVPVQYLENSTVFMLKVRGDSMVDAGILDGDFIMVKQQATAVNGDIVAALIGEEATVKRFFKDRTVIRLQPENPAFEPILCPDGVTILGKVIGLFRKF
jgi:repressor LexA